MSPLYDKAILKSGGASLNGGAHTAQPTRAGRKVDAIKAQKFLDGALADAPLQNRVRTSLCDATGSDYTVIDKFTANNYTTLPTDNPGGDWTWLLVAGYALMNTGDRFTFYPRATAEHTGVAGPLSRLHSVISKIASTFSPSAGQTPWEVICAGKQVPFRDDIRKEFVTALTSCRNVLGPKTSLTAIVKDMCNEANWSVKPLSAIMTQDPYTYSITDEQMATVHNVVSDDNIMEIARPGSIENIDFVNQHLPVAGALVN